MRLLPSVKVDDPSLRVKTALGDLRNPIGLAAGFDKTAEHLTTLQRLGFGYLVAGTVTLEPWPGNPKPRVVRNTREKSMVNCLGFPNPGVEIFIRNLRKQNVKVPVVGSVSGRTVESVVECYAQLQPHVAGIEINLSSPNTSQLKDLREPESFAQLANLLRGAKRKPTFLKISPLAKDSSDFELKTMKLVRIWEDLGFEGATVANSLPVSDPRLSIGAGGYSGPALFPNLVNALKIIRQNVSREFEINAVGGISSSENMKAALSQGANTVQLFTAIIFEGPGLIKHALKEMETRNQNLDPKRLQTEPRN